MNLCFNLCYNAAIATKKTEIEMKTEHPHAATLISLAKGHKEFQTQVDNDWEDADEECVLKVISLGIDPSRIRIKPKTRTVNGIVVPEPYFGTMKEGQRYYYPDCDAEEDYLISAWFNYHDDKSRMERGLVHLTAKNAVAWSKAWRATCAPEKVTDVEAVEKPELNVGQKWLTRGGDEVKVIGQNRVFTSFVMRKDGSIYAVNSRGMFSNYDTTCSEDLIKLIPYVSEGGGV